MSMSLSDVKNREDPLPTRTSLLRQVQNEGEQTQWEAGWEEFYTIYQPLIFGVARQCGLNTEESEDVVQAVMAELRRRIGGFEPNRERGPFKAWLLKLVRWRIADKLAERLPLAQRDGERSIEEVIASETAPAPCGDEEWNQAWRRRLLDEALERVRARADARQFQIFRVCTSQKVRAKTVAESFGVSTMQVYLAKHRIAKLVKNEIERLEQFLGRE
jgi:RNA polymerase sigma factor (sigma-70 family)